MVVGVCGLERKRRKRRRGRRYECIQALSAMFMVVRGPIARTCGLVVFKIGFWSKKNGWGRAGYCFSDPRF